MNIKPFNFDEFVKVAYGEKGLSVWNDYYYGMTGEKLAEKYGMTYTKMQTFLINLRSHVSFWDYASSYKGKDWAKGILIILTVYSAYLVDDDSPNRIRAINAVLRKCNTVEEFLNMSDEDFLKLRNVGKKTASYLSKIRVNVANLIGSRNKTAS